MQILVANAQQINERKDETIILSFTLFAKLQGLGGFALRHLNRSTVSLEMLKLN